MRGKYVIQCKKSQKGTFHLRKNLIFPYLGPVSSQVWKEDKELPDRDKNGIVTIKNRFLRKILLVDCQIECQMKNFIKKQKQEEQAKNITLRNWNGLAMN